MSKTRQNSTKAGLGKWLKGKDSRTRKLTGLIVVGLFTLVGVYLLLRSLAGTSGRVYFNPSSGNQPNTFSVQVRLNPNADSAFSTRLDVSYPTDKLQLVSVTNPGSSFPQIFANDSTADDGNIRLSRGVAPGSGAVTTDALVVNLNFSVKAGATGSVNLSYSLGEAYDGQGSNIIGTKDTATYTLPQAPTDALPVISGINANPTSVKVGGSSTITVTATDDKGINRVEFSRNGQAISSDNSQPYTAIFSTAGLAPNTYTITARAFDTANQSVTATVNVQVTPDDPVASGVLYIVPPSGNQTGQFGIDVKLNTAGETVSALDARLSYDNSKLEFLSADDSTSDFETRAPGGNNGGNGTVTLIRGHQAGLNGANLQVARINFRVRPNTNSSTIVSFASGEALKAVGGQNIVATRNPANYNLVTPDDRDRVKPTRPGKPRDKFKGHDKIEVEWEPASDNVGVTNYKVFRNGVHIATVTGTTYMDVPLAQGTQYTYTVSALDAAGNESDPSDASVLSTTSATGENPPVVNPNPTPGGGVGVTPKKPIPPGGQACVKINGRQVSCTNTNQPVQIPDSNLSNGENQITVETFDGSGNLIDSSGTTISVSKPNQGLWSRIAKLWPLWLLLLAIIIALIIWLWKRRKDDGNTTGSYGTTYSAGGGSSETTPVSPMPSSIQTDDPMEPKVITPGAATSAVKPEPAVVTPAAPLVTPKPEPAAVIPTPVVAVGEKKKNKTIREIEESVHSPHVNQNS